MRKLYVFIIIMLANICLLHGQTLAQAMVSGIVKDAVTQKPVANASVVVKSSKKGTTTNADGKFTLSCKTDDELIITYVGYVAQTFVVQSVQKEIVINLSPSDNKLDNVVVVGYQRQSLRKSTAAVQMVTSKEIQNLPAPSFDQILQGKVAGVNIQNFNGAPGVRNTFTVRGNSTIVTDLNSGVDAARTLSTPLYVIDGMPLSVTDLESASNTGTNFLAGINVNDIESIVVQKDAAATAAWGSRGANGVIVIKTKRGRPGKPEFHFNYYAGITRQPKLLKTLTGTAERDQKLDILYGYGTYDNLRYVPQILTDSLNPSFNNATDWQSLFYQDGIIHNADLSISAGNDVLNYRVGTNYYTEDGIVRQTGFSRYSLRGNFDFKITSKLNANMNLSLSRLNRKRGLGRGSNDVLPINNTQIPSSLFALPESDKQFYLGQYDDIRDLNLSDEANAYLQINYDIIKGIQYSLQGSFSKTTDLRERFQPKEITADGRSFGSNERSDYEQFYLANVLTASKSINDVHNISLVATQSFQLDTKRGAYIYGYNIPGGSIQVISGVPQKDLTAYSAYQQAGLLSYIGQLAYDYKGKYIINGSIRADASSRFGANNKWGYFPAISVAWIVSDENFMQKFSWINTLKLRGSYGLSGTMPDDFYAPFNTWDVTQGFYNGDVMAAPSFYKPLTLPNLTWNKANQWNAGVDIYMFKNRVNVTVDGYQRNTINPILSFPFPFFTGYTSSSFNTPLNILNEGVDVLVQTRNLSPHRKLQWNTNLTLSFNRNRIAELPNGNRSFFINSAGYNQSLIFSVGSPVYGWAQMQYTGVYNNYNEIPLNPITGQPLTYFKGYVPIQPGFPVWVDVNHDGDVWSDEDKGQQFGDLLPTGDPNPKCTGGLYNEFTWKNFSLGVQCIFTIGRDIINNFESNQYTNVLSGFNSWGLGPVDAFGSLRIPDLSGVNYWTPQGLVKDPSYQADFPSINPYGSQFYQFLPFSTMYNEDGSYLKVRSIMLGYSFGNSILNKLHLKNARIYSVIDNVFTISNSDVPDPELVSPQGEYFGGAFPLPRKYTLGIDVTF